MKRALSLMLFVGLVALVAFAAGQFMPGAWYATLAKPTWTPPNWLFAPVWSMLYLMIAVAGWLIWHSENASSARGLWALQLALNGIWSPVMFGWHKIGLALAIIVAMWIAIAALIATAWSRTRTVSWLLLPYLLWVIYATALNAAIWWLNR